MNNLSQYIFEKLRINKDTSIENPKYHDSASREAIKFLRRYIPDLDEYKYYIDIVNDDEDYDTSYLKFHFVYSLPDIWNQRLEMEHNITDIKINGEQAFSGEIGIWKKQQCIIIFLNEKN